MPSIGVMATESELVNPTALDDREEAPTSIVDITCIENLGQALAEKSERADDEITWDQDDTDDNQNNQS